MAVSAMKAGAVEFLPKPFREQQLIEAVAEAMDRFERDEEDVRARNAYQLDITYLSPKERAILDDLSSGFQIKEIATRHTLSASTIRVHRRNIKSKIKIETLSQFLILHNKYGKKF
jgi:FixJ family two-component response regulator